jgi:hypothetical protein
VFIAKAGTLIDGRGGDLGQIRGLDLKNANQAPVLFFGRWSFAGLNLSSHVSKDEELARGLSAEALQCVIHIFTRFGINRLRCKA